MKRGLSPVISAVLLIALVIAVGVIVFLWMTDILKKNEGQASEEQLCDASNFIVGDFCYETISIENIGTGEFENKVRIKFNGRNEASEPELEGFMVFLDYDARTISISSLMGTEIEGFASKSITTDFIEDITDIKQIRVVPKINKDNQIIICEKKETVIDWGEVKAC